ncbi:MAG: NADH-quinone oxidoreductase subunit NuoE [Gemmobacter sp.]|uniref:NADH-quinone oxidoreductase subunit NuoE n=1 Tax=Gemmobacter sp. TaxID=1898957 RepID=UPI00391ADEDE
MLRRLAAHQPAGFAFTPANQAWAEAQITKYPPGRQASAIIPLLWRAQEQEGWLSKPAIEHVADMLGMPYIRALEVATFYFMFQLHPVGSVANIQICGTTSCMICGAEDLVEVCQRKIAAKPHTLSADGKFSWEEVECLGACANAPMAQIGKDYYEDLTPERLEWILDELSAGRVPVPGPQNGRYASEPKSGLTSLKDFESGRTQYNASAQAAVDIGDTVKRIDGTEVPLVVSWKARAEPQAAPAAPAPAATPAAAEGTRPQALAGARDGRPDDLKKIEGIGPVLEKLCHELGIFHYDQIAAWGPAEVAWMDSNLKGFKGRVSRDRWVAQAKLIGEVGMDEFLRRARTNDY